METLLTKNTDKILFERDIQDILPERRVHAGKEEETHASCRMKEIYENILYCIENKMIYLDTTINLSKFSLLLCTNTTYLSKVINIFFKCNLKTLLNKYRIEYAKELLKMEHCDLKTLPKRCGFASRSSFYAAFMKYEHIAPTDFRAHHMSIEIRKKIDMEIDNLLTI